MFKKSIIGFLLLISLLLQDVYASQDYNVAPNLSDRPSAILVSRYRNVYNDYSGHADHQQLSVSLEELQESIFFNVPRTYDSSNFLRHAREIKERIQEEQDHIGNDFSVVKCSFKHTLRHLDQRINLARIDENIRLGDGIRENFNHPHFLPLHQASYTAVLQNITGRIFQVDVEDNYLMGTSSATMCHWNNAANTLTNFVHGTLMNSVFTCAHAITSKEGVAEAYFLPSSSLNLVNGYPTGVRRVDRLLNYLRNNANSFSLSNFHIKNRRNIPALIRSGDLKITQPHFLLDKEDCVVVELAQRPGQNLPPYNSNPLGLIGHNYTIDFNNSNPLQNQTRYFTLGYPACSHYEKLLLNANHNTALVRDEGLSPLIITSALSYRATRNRSPLTINTLNGTIQHRSPASQGMSGGPIFFIDPLNAQILRVIGCIANGEDNDEGGCHFF